MPQLEMAKTEVRERLEELQVLRKGEQLLVEEGSKMRSKMAGLEKEVSDLEVQVGHQTKKLEEAERVRRGLEGERREMMVALEEAESALEQEENRVARAQMEIANSKAKSFFFSESICQLMLSQYLCQRKKRRMRCI